ncbi:MAG: VOC family protein [Flavobacteriales bacterium]|nr:VOC family protein [Flavobacteriales bacterium]
MKKVIGLGGVFYKVKDPEATRNWYAKHLGIKSESWGTVFQWKDAFGGSHDGYSVWSQFKKDSTYFNPSDSSFMINFIVDDLFALLDELKISGIECIGEPTNDEFGKFGWIMDPDGIKIELWEPPANKESE